MATPALADGHRTLPAAGRRAAGRIVRLLDRHRRVVAVVLHVALMAGTNFAAFWLRFDGAIPEPELQLFATMLPWLIGIRVIVFVPCRLFEGLWRYVSVHDLRNLLVGIVVSSVVFYAYVHGIRGLYAYPRSVFVIDALLLAFSMGGLRLVYRMWAELQRVRPERRVLIYGAGDTGESIVRDMLRHHDHQPVAFVDDDPGKVGQRIHGVPILGTRVDLGRVIERCRPHEVLIAIPSAEPSQMRGIVKALEAYSLPITTLPALRELVTGEVTTHQVRRLSIEDLLPRAPVGLDPAPVQRLLTGQRVMVTGAGGSIGSELARQIAALHPSALVLYERYENSLYTIANELADRDPFVPVHLVIGDVTDRRRVDAVLAEHRPSILFHAAAHKHVPMMEWNPCEAVKNNVTGTRIVAEAAERRGVRRFVLISTDKAVNPSSVMGVTKRIGELIVQSLATQSRTAYITVRFGNVLGSNGSVVPRFLQQIEAGGPVTVTHPEMRRFFMLISEAVQLVLHAAALGQPGALYALDMGEQVRLVDLARSLIRLSGRVPGEDVAITFTGLRPGEKLSEELVASDERVQDAGIEKILHVLPRPIADRTRLHARITQLERQARAGDVGAVADLLVDIVPGFHSPGSRARSVPAPAPPAGTTKGIAMAAGRGGAAREAAVTGVGTRSLVAEESR